jgi:hypothetical protein
MDISQVVLNARDSIARIIAKFVNPLNPIGAIFWVAGVEFANRYGEVSKSLRPGFILDVGAGGRSVLACMGFEVISFDIRSRGALDVVGSAVSLPFRENTFTSVICVDTIEHIPKNLREKALLEMMRVTREKVLIHCPLENGKEFLGRKYDMLFQKWFKKVHGYPNPNTTEHIANVEPRPDDFLALNFTVRGTQNAALWLKYMTLRCLPSKVVPLNVLISWIFFLMHKSKNTKPPYWGGICVYAKD